MLMSFSMARHVVYCDRHTDQAQHHCMPSMTEYTVNMLSTIKYNSANYLYALPQLSETGQLLCGLFFWKCVFLIC
ncbi:protein of unknown function [Magnetospirillum gryphiswaldense MSR-1 v2]|uniref:Uncharacterized protein n=1 Tax=Magnetospirillum gryphiswaldense (strain DSM 6361 / JCM 21280 / NBRC 15271 / MSR-1) TaxID=431944 RepID=V6EVU9_MAGGM|nr:protein of unknown function [Magnetospirillum gryphiswaldense MSR-1 v2]